MGYIFECINHKLKKKKRNNLKQSKDRLIVRHLAVSRIGSNRVEIGIVTHLVPSYR